MSFRTKLLFVVLFTIFASVSVVAYAVTHYTQAAFEAMDAERTEALVAQFKKEFVQRGAEIAQQAKNIAEANFTERMAIDMSRPNADLSLYVRDAIGSAQEHGLDYVEFVNYDGVLISSAQFPARVGYKNDWLTAVKDWNETTAFLKKEELADGVALSLSVVRTTPWRTRVCTSSAAIGWTRISLLRWFCPQGCGRLSIPTSSLPLFQLLCLAKRSMRSNQNDSRPSSSSCRSSRSPWFERLIGPAIQPMRKPFTPST